MTDLFWPRIFCIWVVWKIIIRAGLCIYHSEPLMFYGNPKKIIGIPKSIHILYLCIEFLPQMSLWQTWYFMIFHAVCIYVCGLYLLFSFLFIFDIDYSVTWKFLTKFYFISIFIYLFSLQCSQLFFLFCLICSSQLDMYWHTFVPILLTQ